MTRGGAGAVNFRRARVDRRPPEVAGTARPEDPPLIRHDREVTAAQTRELLRRLRDISLAGSGIELASGAQVRLAGCISADQPIERGVHYALEDAQGGRHVLELHSAAGKLALSLASLEREPRNASSELAVELASDRFGRVSAPALGARIDMTICDPRDIEHFLRRLVRAALAAAHWR